jgi:hypothetical protein
MIRASAMRRKRASLAEEAITAVIMIFASVRSSCAAWLASNGDGMVAKVSPLRAMLPGPLLAALSLPLPLLADLPETLAARLPPTLPPPVEYIPTKVVNETAF